MRSGILGADRGLTWHRAVAPGVDVVEIATHGLALSRPRRGFESRWGHQPTFIEVFWEGFPPRRGRKPLLRATSVPTEPEALLDGHQREDVAPSGA